MRVHELIRTPATHVLVLCVALFIWMLPGAAQAEERILDFGVSLEVTEDARLLVKESIVYDFGDAQKHGIYRDIPYAFTDTMGEVHDLTFEVLGVTDGQGTPYLWKEESSGGVFHIRIGDPDRTITGSHVYTISYAVENAIVHLPEKDEIYWNVTGNGWNVPINDVYVSVVLPDEARGKELGRFCYRGGVGSKDECMVADSDGKTVFTWQQVLAPHEGVTVAVGFPKGVVVEPQLTVWQKFLRWLAGYADILVGVGIPLIVSGTALYRWYYYGRDPKGRGVIVPEYEAPSNLSILESAYILNTALRPKDISALIISLAQRGVISVKEVDSKFLLVFSKKDYQLIKQESDVVLTSDEKYIVDTIFFFDDKGTPVTEKLVSELDPLKMRSAFYRSKSEVGKLLLQKKLFTRDPFKSLLDIVLLLGFFAVSLISAWVDFSSFLSPIAILGIIIAVVIAIAVNTLMPQMTKEGAIVREKLLGLKRYIEVAEKDRIKFHNAPEKTPELFEKLLPYAMLFGLTEIWVREFEGILKEPPSWYSGPAGTWAPIAFASDLDGFSSSFASAAAPSSGGSGGGGFSGGGGGGGGGGSW